ncbi:hypothetical protein ONE63_001013 [Megalurothrips usitatus]|uniref:Uncharacterized protein n=1 Tax=Megalurothrips usitatus TaxID=439358 RepID=A0AAV7XEU0_9NEOP|nr:hypothetical protein ONE63_001013 [Megalurothrips usitatus]
MPKLPRQYVQCIVSAVSSYVNNGVLPNLKSSIISSVQLDGSHIVELGKVFFSYTDLFSHLSTEHRRLKYFEGSGCYIPPISHLVGEVDVSIKTADGPVLKTKQCFVQSIPLDKVLKKYLEIPGALNEILSYMNALDVNSEYIVLPLHAYFDDVECNNSLGSHPGKLGAVYASISCLPPECQSKVENIFLASVFESWMRDFGDDKVFAPTIALLKLLEEQGIIVDTPEGPKTVYFITGLLLGDNQGLNSVSGLVECFTSNFCCRFCKTHKSELVTQSTENCNSLRTKQSYDNDIATDDPSLTGVKKDSVFNQLPSFHVTSNYSVDVFHDLCEGVCHYVMIHLLKNCVPTYFSVSELNHRIDMFQYGACDSNRIPPVSNDVTSRRKLKMSGSETLLFVKLFGVLVGDKVPIDNMYWKLYLKLLELLDICLSKNLSVGQYEYLKVLVKEFNEMYVQTTGDTLKAKMHLLVHYATVFRQSGPFSGMSTKRYESKHRSLTIPAHATESRRNICLTVAIQHQLNLCHRFMSKVSILPQTELGPCSELLISDFDNETFVNSLPDCIRTLKCFLSPEWVQLKGTEYRPAMVLLLGISDCGGPCFGVLEAIISHSTGLVFIHSCIDLVGFDEHVHGYEVQVTDKWSCVNPLDLYDPLPLSIYHSCKGIKYVILRYKL